MPTQGSTLDQGPRTTLPAAAGAWTGGTNCESAGEPVYTVVEFTQAASRGKADHLDPGPSNGELSHNSSASESPRGRGAGVRVWRCPSKNIAPQVAPVVHAIGAATKQAGSNPAATVLSSGTRRVAAYGL